MRSITICTIISGSILALAVSPRAVTVLSPPREGPDPALVSAEAVWLMHLDLERALATRLGRLLFDAGAARMDFDSSEFGEETGIDPMREIKRVTAYGFDEAGGPGVIILEATPAIDLVIDKLKEEHGEVTSDVTEGYDILRWDEGVASIRTTGLTGRMVVFGPESECLVKALRVIDGALPSLADRDSSPLRHTIRPGSFLSVNVPDVADLRDRFGETGKAPEMLRAARAITLELGEADGIAFLNSAFATPNEGDAADIADVAQGLLAMARLMLREEPELADIEPLLRAITVRAEGPTVRFLLEMPSEALPDSSDAAAGDGGDNAIED